MKQLFRTLVTNAHILIISLVMVGLGVGTLSAGSSTPQTHNSHTTQSSAKPLTHTAQAPPVADGNQLHLRLTTPSGQSGTNQNTVAAPVGGTEPSSTTPPILATPPAQPPQPSTCDSSCALPPINPEPTPVDSCGVCGSGTYHKPALACPMYCVDNTAN